MAATSVAARWAADLSRLPQSAQVLLINPAKLRACLRSKAWGPWFTHAIGAQGGPRALEFVQALLTQVDTTRPIAIGYGAVSEEARYADARFGAVAVSGMGIAPVIHTRVLVPARDPVGMAALAERVLESFGFVPEPGAGGLPSNAVLLGSEGDPGSTRSVLLIREATGLRAEFVWAGYRSELVSDVQREAIDRLAGPLREVHRPQTPAVRLLVEQRPLVGVVSTPEGIANLSFALAVDEAARAMATVDPHQRLATWTKGIAIAAEGFNMLDPRDRMVADSAGAIELEGRLDGVSVSSLTPLGASIKQRARPDAGHVFEAKDPAPAFMLQAGTSLRASLAASAPLHWGRHLDDQIVSQRWPRIGGFAAHGVVSSASWPTLETLKRVLDPRDAALSRLLPDAYTVVIPRDQPQPGRLALAVALDYRPDVDTTELQHAIADRPWPSGSTPTVEVREVAGRTLVLVGVHVDPNDIFDLESARKIGPVHRATLALPSREASAQYPGWARWYDAIGPWAEWVDIVGHAHIANRSIPASQLATKADEDSRGWLCLRDLAHVSVDSLDALSDRLSKGAYGPNPSKTRAAALDALAAELEPLLRCAADDPESRAMAKTIRASWQATLAEWRASPA